MARHHGIAIMARPSAGLLARVRQGVRGRGGAGGRIHARGLCDPPSPASAAAKLTRWNVGGPRADQVCFAAPAAPAARSPMLAGWRRRSGSGVSGAAHSRPRCS